MIAYATSWQIEPSTITYRSNVNQTINNDIDRVDGKKLTFPNPRLSFSHTFKAAPDMKP